MKKFLTTTAIALCVSGGFFIKEARVQEIIKGTANAISILDDENIHTIVLNGTPEDVKQILQNSDNINSVFMCNTLITTVIKSSTKGQLAADFPAYAIEKMKILIEAGADVNANACPEKMMSPLAWAITLPQQLYETENDVNKVIDEKMKIQTEFCDIPPIVSKLCKDITSEERAKIRKIIHITFENLNKKLTPYFMDSIKILVNNGANIRYKDFYGQNVLHRAALNPRGETLEPLKYLIEKGADINEQDVDGNTPLFIAFALQNEEAVNLLIDNGADTTIRNNNGITYNQVKAARKRTFSNEEGNVRIELKM